MAIKEYEVVENQLTPNEECLKMKLISSIACLHVVHEALKNIDCRKGSKRVLYETWMRGVMADEKSNLIYNKLISGWRNAILHQFKFPKSEIYTYMGTNYKRFVFDEFTEKFNQRVGVQSSFVLQDALSWWEMQLQRVNEIAASQMPDDP